ncbi:MAG: hypothetical protein A2X97_10310 [Bdellovibrionales bacterium GWA1_52_35]|nr:MAG: hypothetical protein A2X97_10310 [Bdellovibrionales bacterium GWA1_52_35]
MSIPICSIGAFGSEATDTQIIRDLNAKLSMDLSVITGSTNRCSDDTSEILPRRGRCLGETPANVTTKCFKRNGDYSIPDNAPVGAVFVSDAVAPTYLLDFVRTVNESAPLAKINVLSDDREATLSVLKRLSNYSQIRDQINLIPVRTFASSKWPQDAFQVVRTSRGYKLLGLDPRSGNRIASAIAAYCEDLSAESITIISENNPDHGGNIEALPNGDFLISGETSPGLANYLADLSGSAPVLAIAGFLQVGHVDEMFTVIGVPGRPAPCNYALVFASPRLAIDQLGRNRNDPLISLPWSTSVPSKPSVNDVFTTQITVKYNEGNWMKGNSTSSLEDQLTSAGLSIKQLGLSKHSSGGGFPAYVFKGTYADFNVKLAQVIIDHNRAIIIARLRKWEQENKCNSPPLIAELPTLWNEQRKPLFPNPVNGVSLGNRFIMPEPHNPSLKQLIIRQLDSIGVAPVFIDNYDTYHQLGGEVHCSSNVVRLCKP